MEKFQRNAIKRFFERGGTPQFFETPDEAVTAAKLRSRMKGLGLLKADPFNVGIFDYDFR